MNLFKASIMCSSCGEIHAERWLESSNRHATNTTLFMLCEPCQMNELVEFDPWEEINEQPVFTKEENEQC